jgi:hypothetical protein
MTTTWNDGTAPGSTPALRRGQRMSDDERASVGQDLLRRYEAGASIREICRETGYSIGRVRRLLEDAGVTYRRRGGANRSRAGRPAAPDTEQPPAAETVAKPDRDEETTSPGRDDAMGAWPGERPVDDGTAR